MKYQGRRVLYKITEYRDGCVYKTQPLHEVWVDIGTPCDVAPPEGHIFVSLSTKRSQELGASGTFRRVDNGTPSIVEVPK